MGDALLEGWGSGVFFLVVVFFWWLFFFASKFTCSDNIISIALLSLFDFCEKRDSIAWLIASNPDDASILKLEDIKNSGIIE